jgi:hypothetical protein
MNAGALLLFLSVIWPWKRKLVRISFLQPTVGKRSLRNVLFSISNLDWHHPIFSVLLLLFLRLSIARIAVSFMLYLS